MSDRILKLLRNFNLSQTDMSYLSDRKQQIKIGNVVSSWAEIKKGVSQGSILGPLLFNVFINDIFYFIKNCDLYNYADNNTLSFHSLDFDEILRVLQSEGKILIDWFCFKCMQVNLNKVHAIAVGKRMHEKSPTFYFGSINITCDVRWSCQTIGYLYWFYTEFWQSHKQYL